MGRLTVICSVTLDGVMQAPARPDEDPRGGFAYGGWAVPFQDNVAAKKIAQMIAEAQGSLLLGRRTYDDFYSVWPRRTDNPYTDHLNKVQKYVASRTLSEPLPWQNSTLLRGDVADAVRALKEGEDANLAILGSGELVRLLIPSGLIDEYVLSVYPIVLGSGRRLFPQGTRFALRLLDTLETTTGVTISTYRAA
jgi:dihydrofolate reductase